MHAARTEIGGMHARAGGAFIEHHQLLALDEAPQRRGERANVHGLRRHIEDVRHDAADFGKQHADQLAALRHFDTEQLLGGEREGMLLVHRRAIVEPVEIGHGLQIGLLLDQLLGAAMKQADMRIDAVDHFTVQLQHEAQNAVRGRMLRTEVDVEIADGGLGHGAPQFVLAFSSPGST